MNFDEKYNEQMKIIKQLKEKLKDKPGNPGLIASLKKEEDILYAYVIKNSIQLENFLRKYNVETRDDDED